MLETKGPTFEREKRVRTVSKKLITIFTPHRFGGCLRILRKWAARFDDIFPILLQEQRLQFLSGYTPRETQAYTITGRKLSKEMCLCPLTTTRRMTRTMSGTRRSHRRKNDKYTYLEFLIILNLYFRLSAHALIRVVQNSSTPHQWYPCCRTCQRHHLDDPTCLPRDQSEIDSPTNP